MENAGLIIGKVNKRFKEESDLHDRMDEDFKLWDLQKTSFATDTDFVSDTIKGSYPEEVNIISNDARTSGDKVQSILSDAEMQIIVRMAEEEGEDKRGDIGKLERLFYFALEKGDERLRRLLLLPLREQLIWYSLYRGWLAGRFLVYKSNGNVIFDFMPLDRRWLCYEMGDNGLLWIGYQTFRSGAAIESEYKVKAEKENDNLVIDYWEWGKDGLVSNIVLHNNDFLGKPETYNLPSMPILIAPVPTRPLIASTSTKKAEVKGYGESIFAPIRGINEVRNKFGSIMATHANLMAKQPLLHYYEPGIDPITKTTQYAGAVLNMAMGQQRIEEMPMKEISVTTVQIQNWLDAQMERGILPNIPVGQPPPSGTLYNLVQEAGNKIFNPQLKNLSSFYADICRLVEEQLISGKLKVKVQQEAERKYYETQVTPVDLKKPHTIKVEFTARTPWSQLDVAQVAQMLKQLGLPDEWVWEYILKIQDPKGVKDLALIEMAEHSPELAPKKSIEAMMKYGRVDDALFLVNAQDKLEAEREMAMQGGTPPEEMPEEAMMPPGGGI